MNAWINEWIKTWCPSSGIDWMYLTSSIIKASCSTLLSNNLEKKSDHQATVAFLLHNWAPKETGHTPKCKGPTYYYIPK